MYMVANAHEGPEELITHIDRMNDDIREKNKHLPANKQIPLILTGQEAERKVGMQHEFAAQLLIQTAHFGIDMMFRAGHPPSYDSIRSPKTGNNLSKTSNHGIGRSLIPADKIFTKLDSYRRPVGHHEKDEKHLRENEKLLAENSNLALDKYPQPVVHLKHTFRDILDMLKEKPDGDLKIEKYDKNTGEMILKYQPGSGPIGFNGEFVINVHEAVPPSREKSYSRPWNKPMERPTRELERIQSTFRADMWAHLDSEFPIYYRAASNAEKKPFNVFSDNEGRPTTGDWDIAAVCNSPKVPDYARRVYNTFDKKTDPQGGYLQQKALVVATETLFRELKKNALEKLKKIQEEIERRKEGGKAKESKVVRENIESLSLRELEALEAFKTLDPVERLLIKTKNSSKLYDNFSLERAGCITPFEFLQARLINVEYANPNSLYGAQTRPGTENPYFDPNIQNLIQHGAENRTPYAPVALEGKILHFYKGLIVLTEGEDQLINFMMSGNYLKNNLIDIHYGWQMSKWAPVLEKQAKLNQINLIDPDANPAEKQGAVKSYIDFKAVEAMERQRTINPFFTLNEERAQTIMRQLYAYQNIPPLLLDKLIKYYQNENHLRAHPFSEQTPGAFKFKDYHWPIEKWAPVLERQLALHSAEPDALPDLPVSLKRCYENYKLLLQRKNDEKMDSSLVAIIDEQLDMGQRSSIPTQLLIKYEVKLKELGNGISKPMVPQWELEDKNLRDRVENGNTEIKVKNEAESVKPIPDPGKLKL